MSYIDEVLSGEYNKKKKKQTSNTNTSVVRKSNTSNSTSSSSSYIDSVLSGEYEPSYKSKYLNNNTSSSTNSNTSTSTFTTTNTNKKEDNRKWFQKGAFEDGYQLGDITKTILGSGTDTWQDLYKGVLRIGEGAIDIGAYAVGGLANLAGNKDLADRTKSFIQRDLIDEYGLDETLANFTPTGLLNTAINGDTEALANRKLITKAALKIYEKQHGKEEAQKMEELINHVSMQDIYNAIKDNNTDGLVEIANKNKEKGIDYSEILPSYEINSPQGDKTDALIQSGGQLLGQTGLQAVGIPWQVVSGVTSFAGGTEEAFANDATYGEAGASGLISAIGEIGSEYLSGGISFGSKTLDQVLTKGATSKIKNRVLRAMTQLGMDAAGEGFEEIVSDLVSNVGKKLTYEDEKTWKEALASDEVLDSYIESFIGGAVMGGVANVPNAISSVRTGRDYKTGLTDNEQRVVDAEVQARLEEQTEGKKLTEKEKAKLKSKIEEQVTEDLQKGYISTDTIENTIGKKLTEAQEADIESEINSLVQQQKEATDIKEQIALEQQIGALNDQLEISRSLDLSNDNYLQRSYQENELKKQNYTYNKTGNEIEDALKESASKYMNNTNRVHELVDTVANIAKDHNTKYEFINNQGIKDLGYDIEGKTVNGLVTKDGKVLINIDSNNALNRIIGHETTHLLEGTNEYQLLQDAVREYAKTKGDYDTKLKELQSIYEGTDANIDNEITSDLVGDYLFTDQDFINTLSTKEPNVFRKVYDYIKHIYKMATAGSKEARQLEELKYRFDQAYKNANSQTAENARYSESNSVDNQEQRNNTSYDLPKDISIKDSQGREIDHNIHTYSTDAYSGQVNMRKEFQDEDGNTIAKIDYNYFDNEINIDLIETSPEYRRKGLATRLLQDLQQDAKEEGMKINYGYTSKDGTALLNSIEAPVVDSNGRDLSKEQQNHFKDSYGNIAPTEPMLGTDYIAFNSNQFKAIDNLNPTDNPDIRYSLSENGELVDSNGDKVTLEASDTGNTNSLMAIHNLDVDKLKGVLELGGFPVPSIAITNPDIVNHNQFGDISVIFNKDTINPANKANEVYDRDVWSPTFPQVDYVLNDDAISDTAKKLGIDWWRLQDYAEDNKPQYLVEKLARNEDIIDKYIKDNNLQYETAYKEPSFKRSYNNTEEMKQWAIKNNPTLEDLSINKQLKEEYLELTQLDEDSELYKTIDSSLDWYSKDHIKNPWLKQIENDLDILTGKAEVQPEIDEYKTRENKEKIAKDNGLEKYLENNVANIYGEKGIRNDRDIFTPSGNRRSFWQLHDEYNLENIVRALVNQDTTGSENSLMTGFGKINAQMSNKFNSIEDIKNNQNRLMADTENANLDTYKETILNDVNELADYYKYPDSRIRYARI